MYPQLFKKISDTTIFTIIGVHDSCGKYIRVSRFCLSGNHALHSSVWGIGVGGWGFGK